MHTEFMDWDDFRVLLAVLDEGSLAAGARALGYTQPTARRRLERLENKLGAVLLTRSTSGVTPTAAGLKAVEQARAMAMAAQAAERDASAEAGALRGRIRISTPNFVGVEVLPLMLAGLRRIHPAITFELDLTDASVDLLKRDADLAIRMYRPVQGALVAKRLPSVSLGLYAHKDLLRGRPPLDTLDSIAAHLEIIGPDRSKPDLDMLERLTSGMTGYKLSIRTDNHLAYLAAVRAGLGVGVVQVPVGNADPDLVRLLPQADVAKLDVWLVMHEELRDAPRIRAVFDHIAAEWTAYAQSAA